jgi:hypothetical protein
MAKMVYYTVTQIDSNEMAALKKQQDDQLADAQHFSCINLDSLSEIA